MSGRPTIAPLVDRPGKNFSIILTNHGRFGVFSTSLKFERGRPRWILSDSRSIWKIQIVSKRMQNASNVSMLGGADHCTIKLQCTACVRTLTSPLFLQWAIGQVLLILPRIGRICLRILGARQKPNKPLAVDARCLLRAIDAVAARKSLKQAWIFSVSHTITPPGSCIHRKAINKDKHPSSGVLPSRQQYGCIDYLAHLLRRCTRLLMVLPSRQRSACKTSCDGTALQAAE